MKTAKRALLLVLCAIALVVASIMGTLAYLQSTTEVVKNTFSAGKVQITLDETDVDVYGVKDSENRVTANDYKLIAGHTYTKDPTVTVKANSEASYVRMVVTINEIPALKAACGLQPTDLFFPGAYVNWDSANWNCVYGAPIENDSAVYVFEYNGKTVLSDVDVALPALFTKLTMPENATNAQILALEDLQIDIQAYAVQADGFDVKADAFAAAFDGYVEMNNSIADLLP